MKLESYLLVNNFLNSVSTFNQT